MDVKPFRLKDPVTGLYYCPSREIKIKTPDGKSKYVKSNLSKKGKVYFKSYNDNEREILDHTQIVERDDWRKGYWPVLRNVKFEVEYL